MEFLINLYFGKEEEVVSFIFFGNSIEEVTQTFLEMKGKQPIDLENGYRIINFDRINYIDILQK